MEKVKAWKLVAHYFRSRWFSYWGSGDHGILFVLTHTIFAKHKH